MSEPFLGEIRINAFNFAPSGWAVCDGAQMQMQQNAALYALLGTQFGGDGKTTFNLPDMRGGVPVGAGMSTAATVYRVGTPGGQETVALTTQQLPQHTHMLAASTGTANQPSPAGNFYGALPAGTLAFGIPSSLNPLHPNAVSSDGSGVAHPNMQPFLVTNFCIALQGIFPSRS
jgi:microcystin-dependent protein